jgi:hypothetical protein
MTMCPARMSLPALVDPTLATRLDPQRASTEHAVHIAAMPCGRLPEHRPTSAKP